MKIRNMRWGYDGGGFACGPVEGNTVVEMVVTDENGFNFFVTEMRMMEFEKITVSEVSTFDLIIEQNHGDVNFDHEMDKIDRNSLETYDFESDDVPDEMFDSRFGKVIEFVRYAMDTYYNMENSDDASAQDFIEKFKGLDIEDVTIPE